MRPTPALLALVLCASIHARPWQLAHCRGPKQAKYSAAWLASSDLLRSLPESYLNTSRLFKRGTMMEAASFLLLEKTATYKTRDFLDFYVDSEHTDGISGSSSSWHRCWPRAVRPSRCWRRSS